MSGFLALFVVIIMLMGWNAYSSRLAFARETLGVLDNQPGCYLKLPAGRGGGSLWDFAATACMFHEAGSVATDVHGGALDLNRPDSTFMNHRGVLFASDERVARRLTRRR